MKFLLDHDVPSDIQRVLIQEGHDVSIVANIMDRTASDREVLEQASKYGAILVTCNRDDFLSLASKQSHNGMIIVFRRKTRIEVCAESFRGVRRNIHPSGPVRSIPAEEKPDDPGTLPGRPRRRRRHTADRIRYVFSVSNHRAPCAWRLSRWFSDRGRP